VPPIYNSVVLGGNPGIRIDTLRTLQNNVPYNTWIMRAPVRLLVLTQGRN
jgi:hypothetical protein